MWITIVYRLQVIKNILENFYLSPIFQTFFKILPPCRLLSHTNIAKSFRFQNFKLSLFYLAS